MLLVARFFSKDIFEKNGHEENKERKQSQQMAEVLLLNNRLDDERLISGAREHVRAIRRETKTAHKKSMWLRIH